MTPTKCTYPDCNCPFDAPADPNWCARGLPKVKPGCLNCETAICDECDDRRPAQIVPFRKPEPYLEGPVRCMRCKHEWHGAMPIGTVAGLECPSCGSMTGVLPGLIQPEGERWACVCENQLFFLDRKGPPLCASCGKRAQGWVDTP